MKKKMLAISFCPKQGAATAVHSDATLSQTEIVNMVINNLNSDLIVILALAVRFTVHYCEQNSESADNVTNRDVFLPAGAHRFYYQRVVNSVYSS